MKTDLGSVACDLQSEGKSYLVKLPRDESQFDLYVYHVIYILTLCKEVCEHIKILDNQVQLICCIIKRLLICNGRLLVKYDSEKDSNALEQYH